MEAFYYPTAIWGYGIAAVAFLIFAVQLAVGWRGSVRGALILAAVAFSACWAASAAAYTQTEARTWWISTVLFGTLRIGAWLVFLLSLLFVSARENQGTSNRWLRLPPWITAVFVITALSNIVLQGMPEVTAALLGPYSQLPFLPPLVLTIGGLMLVEQVVRNLPVASRWAIKPLCLALTGMFCFDLYFFTNAFLFKHIDVDVWSARGIVNALVLPLIAMSSARNKDWAFQIAISRHIVFHSAALLGSGLYLLGVAGAGYYLRYFGGSWGAALETVLLFSGLLSLSVFLLSGSLRSKLRVFLNKHFFSYRYDYRDEWLRFTQSLSSQGPLSADIPERAIKALADLVESPGGCLWLADPAGSMRLAARLNFPDCKDAEPADSPLLEFLRRTQWVLDLNELRDSPHVYDGMQPPAWLKDSDDAWLVIPMFSGDALFGFTILATPRAKIDVNWEVLDLLKTAASQAASYLANMRAAEALLEAKKFDSFNRMSAFVVHDVKNLVAQLSLLLKNAEKHKDNPEFQRDMFMTIDHVVDRMKHLLLQLRAGTTPIDQPRPVALADIVERVRRAKAGQEPAVEATVERDVDTRGHAERLERVIGHLVQNSLDATPADGKVWIRLSASEDTAVIEVGDTGHGMSPEFIRERLFKPFDSTKSAGMGIGAYESAQYVAELGGRVSVESKENSGTIVKVHLPVHRPKAKSPSAEMEKA